MINDELPSDNKIAGVHAFLGLEHLEADAHEQQAKGPRQVSLNEVRELAEKQQQLEAEVEALEAQVVSKKQELRQVAEVDLPELFALAGLPAITLSDGSTIGIMEQVAASIGDENREKAHAWLREQGFGDLIKNVVSVTFGKGEDKDAQLLIHNIHVMADNDTIKFGTLDQKETVHPSTLKSFVKEQLKDGKPLPAETFKLFIRNVAVLKKPKVPK